MNNNADIQGQTAYSSRRLVGWALVLSSMISTPAISATNFTDISSSPITSTNAAQVKPNIMLLMDTSYSMGWSHMPDEIETDDPTMGIETIGYKAAQCNVLYYNPAQTYTLPKNADGSSFPTPSFYGARYDPFDSTNTATVDLSGHFKAYDTNTLRTSGYEDTPPSYAPPTSIGQGGQAAYYYVKTGGSVPITAYNSSPCQDSDNQASVASSDGGMWTRTVVGSSSGIGNTDERANFATWYSYYRTRILLIKSAASLAFTPLTDSFRVGFITVKPKDNRTDSTINQDKYLAIDDFTTTQRGLWYAKLFSQKPSGSSPTREGLARVGRHYAGMHDGINAGMDGDPVQFSCQQNFTIMTTDGYWNATDESRSLGSGYIGGPVDITGKALVGQRDGSLDAFSTNNPSPPPAADLDVTPRPIWDGTFDGLRTIRNKTIHNQYLPCGSYFTRTTSQLTKSTTQLQRETVQTTTATVQNLQSTSQLQKTTLQNLAATSQTTQSTMQMLKSTRQNLLSSTQRLQSTTQTLQNTVQLLVSTNQNLRTTTQNLMSTSASMIIQTHPEQTVYTPLQSTQQMLQSTQQALQSTSQQNQQTVQHLQSTQQNLVTYNWVNKTTSQTTQVTTQNLQHTEQVKQSTQQTLQSTAQTTATTSNVTATTTTIQQSTSQLQITTSQVKKSTHQERSCNAQGENCTPGPVGSCVPSSDVVCSPVNTGPTLVASCTNDTARAGNNWTSVTCTTSGTGPSPAGSCTNQSPTSSNSYTTVSCNTVTSGPTNVAACNQAAAGPGNSYTNTSCNTIVSQPTYVASCSNSGPNSGNNYVATSCNPTSSGPVGVQSCTGQSPDSSNGYTTITCGTNNTPNTGVATCNAAPGDSTNQWVTTTCTPNNTTDVPVASCGNSGPTAGNGYTTTTCSSNNTADVGVPSCTASPANSGNNYTATVCGTNNTSTPSGSCVADSPTSSNGYTTTTCPTVNGGATYVDPASCSAGPGNAGNNWTTTTCPPQSMGPSAYSGSCFGTQYTTGPPQWYSYTCSTNNTTDVPVASCTPSGPTSGNGWTTTTCRDNDSAMTPTASCTYVAPDNTNNYTATTCPVVATTNVPVQTCNSDPTPNSGNNYTSTTCTPNNTSNVPVQSCSASGASSGNGWTTTTCTPNNTANVAVNSCTPQGPSSSNNWVTTTCPPEQLVSGPTAVGSCTPVPASDSNGHQRTDCNTVTQSSPIASSSCVPSGPTAGNGYVTTTCSNAPTPYIPVQSCTYDPPTSANNYVETNCSTNNQTNVPVASCTPSGPTSGNSWVTTTCPTPVTTGPTPTASCTAAPATNSNNYVSTSCPAPNVSTPAGVQTCNPVAADNTNNYTSTVCTPNNTSNVGVQTCNNTPADGSNGWTTTTCADNNQTNVPVASCTAQTGSGSNGWMTITCPSPVVTTNQPAQSCFNDPFPVAGNSYTTTSCTANNVLNTPSGNCVADSPTSTNNWVTTTCPVLTTPPTGVASCNAATGDSSNSWTTTTCSNANSISVGSQTCSAQSPTSANGYQTISCYTATSTDQPVQSCSASVAGSGNQWLTTTCRQATTSTPSQSCNADPATNANQWVQTTCPVIDSGVVGASSCVASGPTSGNNWTTTTCPGTATTGPTPTGSCTNAPADGTNSWTQTSCNTVYTGPDSVTNCNPASANAGNSWTTTNCAPAAGLQLNTTTYFRTQQFNVSGNTPTSAGTDVTTTDGPNPTGACYLSGTQPPLPADGEAAWTSADSSSYPSCSQWPCQIDVNNNDPHSINSLADVAQYYYITDLRTASNEPRGINYYRDDVPAVGSGPEDDRVRWQHMTTFSIALGVSGQLQYRSDYKTATVGDFAHIRTGSIPVGDTSGTGATNWPLWPDPSVDYASDPNRYNDPRSIDDFWHAAVNGRGTYFSAGNPTSVIAGLAGALAGITSRVASSTGAGASNLEPVTGDNFVYLASYATQKWTGDVQAHEIDVVSGAIQPTALWSAQTLLDGATGASCDNRKIYLLGNGSSANNLTNFTWNTSLCDGSGNPTGSPDSSLSTADQSYFAAANVQLLSQYPSMTDGSGTTPNQRAAAPGANLVNFLRGQRGLENFASGVANQLYRQREHVLGDIVDGQPVYVRSPFASYADSGYGAFKTAQAGRAPMLYVAANDGMLHAFYAGRSATDTQGGKEAWAVIPRSVLPNLFKLADANYKNVHQYYVDGTPTVTDLYDGTNWRTVLVGGLNGGGKGYYALDVTDPVNPQGLWEFNWNDTVCPDPATPAAAVGNTSDCHIGLSFGKPLISKLADGRWVVMVTSGYNNVNTTAHTGDGRGYLYVLNALTGQIIYKIPTSAGDQNTPSGLAQINNFVEKADIDNTTVRVYGTDVLGNIWRFDVNDNTPPSGREASLLGTATDNQPTPQPQPITTRPELTEVGGQPMLFVGTGKLLGATDTVDVQHQSIYGILDPINNVSSLPPPIGSPGTLRSALAPLALTQVGNGTGAYRTVACTGSTAQCGSTAGWVIDFPDVGGAPSGERVNVEMKLRSGTLIVGSNVPNISACSAGGYSWLNYLNYQSGLAVTGATNLSVSESVANSLIVGLTVIKLQDGTLRAIVTTSDAGVLSFTPPTYTQPTSAKRTSWREVISQ